MIEIKSTINRNLNTLAEEHRSILEPLVLGRIGSLKLRQQEFITSNISAILTALPKDLFALNKAYVAQCIAPGKNKLLEKNVKKGLHKVFNYKHFSATKATYYCTYDLAKKLNVNTCPYCNRNYTVTVDQGKRITRPDFDHFFSQKTYPLMALSFYNLVPSCLVCNRSVKNQSTTIYNKFCHPYEEGFGTAAKFNFIALDMDSHVGLGENYHIDFEHSTIQPEKARRCKKNVELFKLKEIYKASHCGEVSDIVRKHHISGGKYLELLQKTFKDLGTIEDLYKVAFGNYWNEEDFIKRPLSKLTKDVVEQLVFLNPLLKPLLII